MKIRMICAALSCVMLLSLFQAVYANEGERPRQMEYLTRGAVASTTPAGGVYLSWRLLGTEPIETVFNVYKNGTLLAENLANTNYTDKDGGSSDKYSVAPVIGGAEGERCDDIKMLTGRGSSALPYAYFDIPIQVPDPGTDTYRPSDSSNPGGANDASVGDVDGDGEYEYILKWDPKDSKDNSQSGKTSNVYIDCYESDGTMLWRIDLGQNIRAGAHYTQFQVYDYDGDGRAEIAMKTAPGSKDGLGKYVSDAGVSEEIRGAQDNETEYENLSGFIIKGPEYLTVFNGKTGAAMQTVYYDPPRGITNSWGKGSDNTNRVDRFLAGTAYLDGVHPSMVFARGYYGKAVVAAYDWDGHDLTQRFKISSADEGCEGLAGQGNHQISVADIDNDGFDEIVYGSAAIDHDGTLAHSMGYGHGDALHVSDFNNDGKQEIFGVLEKEPNWGAALRTGDGREIWHKTATSDDGRGIMAYFSRKYGSISIDQKSGICKMDGSRIKSGTGGISPNFCVYWDGDLCREHLDGTTISKWDDNKKSFKKLLSFSNVKSNNTTKQNPCLQADILGDWREEIILRRADNKALRVFTSLCPSDYMFTTFMHDSQYRCAVAWQNTAYNQPPHQSYYIGYDKTEYTQPDIYTVRSEPLLCETYSISEGTLKNGLCTVSAVKNEELDGVHLLIAAAYGTDGELLSAASSEVSMIKGEAAEITLKLDAPDDAEMRCFIWDSTENMQPLSNIFLK